jgi:hypothetical protein
MGCGSSSQPADSAQLEIVDEQGGAGDGEPADEDDDTPPELMLPSKDPATTCMRVAERLDRCSTRVAAAALDDLEPEERSQAEAAIVEAAKAIAEMRAQCQAPLDEGDAAYVQTMGKCLPLGCAALRACISRASS